MRIDIIAFEFGGIVYFVFVGIGSTSVTDSYATRFFYFYITVKLPKKMNAIKTLLKIHSVKMGLLFIGLLAIYYVISSVFLVNYFPNKVEKSEESCNYSRVSMNYHESIFETLLGYIISSPYNKCGYGFQTARTNKYGEEEYTTKTVIILDEYQVQEIKKYTSPIYLYQSEYGEKLVKAINNCWDAKDMNCDCTKVPVIQ